MKKLLLKGTLFLAIACVMASCTQDKATEAPLNESKEENSYETNRNTLLDNDIQHQLSVFTAGKAWLERSEKASIAGRILTHPFTKSF